jgi:hypothetical protein
MLMSGIGDSVVSLFILAVIYVFVALATVLIVDRIVGVLYRSP